MTERIYISTEEAAAALGVGVSTVKRWADTGVLPADRTAGGHRKLLRAQVLNLARAGRLPAGKLDAALLPGDVFDAKQMQAALLDVLLAGRADEARALLARARRDHVPIARIADEVIAPVMAEVGRRWHAGKIDVWHEHRASHACMAALHDVQADLQANARGNRPTAVGGAAEGDPYYLPSLLVQMVLLEEGWNAVNLGPDVPFASLTGAMKELRPKLVWLSVSHLGDRDEFIRKYKTFFRQAEHAGVAVAIGGSALVPAVRTAIPYTTFGDRLSHLAAFARTLNPRPKPPKRGRPRKSAGAAQ